MRSRERSEALVLTLAGPGEEQEQLAALAPSSGASRHLLPLRRRRAAASRDDGWASVSGFYSPNKTKPRIAGLRQVHACAPIHITTGSLHASGSSSAEPNGMPLQQKCFTR